MNVLQKLDCFIRSFKGEKGIVGTALSGAPIWYFCVRKTAYPTIIAQYSIHAREYITTLLALEQIKDFCRFGKKGTVYFLPMLNPDGVQICLTQNPLYKANGRGVDLNVNFNANWGTGEKNQREPGSENYIGLAPFSEPETRALKDFTLFINPDLTLSCHSKGEEIYYQFFQTGKRLKRDLAFAQIVREQTGYDIKATPNSAGGYKDWCVKWLKIPSITIEVGSDDLTHPIGERYLTQIYQKNQGVIRALTESEKWN